MDARQDALATAAQVILAVQELANNHPGDPVGTVGKLQLWPNAANVVPGQVMPSVWWKALWGSAASWFALRARPTMPAPPPWMPAKMRSPRRPR